MEALVSGQCRFRDCTHAAEPGCAVQDAIARGELTPDRFAAWQKLQREVAYEVRKIDRNAERLERKKWRRIQKNNRAREAFRRRNE